MYNYVHKCNSYSPRPSCLKYKKARARILSAAAINSSLSEEIEAEVGTVVELAALLLVAVIVLELELVLLVTAGEIEGPLALPREAHRLLHR